MTTQDTVVIDKAELWKRIAHQTAQRNTAFEACQNYSAIIAGAIRQLNLIKTHHHDSADTVDQLTKIREWCEDKRTELSDYVTAIDRQNEELTRKANGE